MKMLSKVFSAVSSITVTHLQPTTKDNKQKLTAHPMDLRKLVYQLRSQNIFKCNTDSVNSNLLGECSWYKSSLKSKSTSVFFLQKLPQTTYNIGWYLFPFSHKTDTNLNSSLRSYFFVEPRSAILLKWLLHMHSLIWWKV